MDHQPAERDQRAEVVEGRRVGEPLRERREERVARRRVARVAVQQRVPVERRGHHVAASREQLLAVHRREEDRELERRAVFAVLREPAIRGDVAAFEQHGRERHRACVGMDHQGRRGQGEDACPATPSGDCRSAHAREHREREERQHEETDRGAHAREAGDDARRERVEPGEVRAGHEWRRRPERQREADDGDQAETRAQVPRHAPRAERTEKPERDDRPGERVAEAGERRREALGEHGAVLRQDARRARPQVRDADRHQDQRARRERRRHGETAPPVAERLPPQRRRHRRDEREQLVAHVHARQALERHGQREQRERPRPRRARRSPGEQQHEREEVHRGRVQASPAVEVHGREGERRRGEERGRPVPRPVPDEREGDDCRDEHRDQDRHVVGEDGVPAREEDGRRHGREAEQVLRGGERVGRGVEDVPLEERRRRGGERVRVPGQDPEEQVEVDPPPETGRGQPHGIDDVRRERARQRPGAPPDRRREGERSPCAPAHHRSA